MGQVEPNLDLFISIHVQREPVDIEDGPQGPFTWHQAMFLGTVELGQIPHEKGQVGQVVVRPLREQHDHIAAAKLPTHHQEGIIACPHIEEPTIGPSSDMRSIGGKP